MAEISSPHQPAPLLECPRDALDIGPMELDRAHGLGVQPRWPLTKTAKGIGIERSSNLVVKPLSRLD